MIQTKQITGAAAFQELATVWDDLAQRGITNTPFQQLGYQQGWWQQLGEGELYTIAVYDDETLLGIGCFNVRGTCVVFNASKEETDYLDVICAAENAQAVWGAIFDCLCSEEFPVWDCLDFYNIPADSSSRVIVEAQAADRGFSFASERAEVCPIIALPATFDDYLETLDKRQRHEIRRKLRRAVGEETVLHIVSPEDDLHAEVDAFLELLVKSTPEKGAWLNAERTQAFHDIAQFAQDAGILQLMFIEVEGQKAAALFNFAYNGRTWVYNSGLDPNAFGRLSLGVVLSAQAIEHAIELGHTTFDFLRGDEAYKYRFGAQDTEIFRLIIQK
jgi:CelD/BcsL family acetyltransferase involved in cellulose biosynthesis